MQQLVLDSLLESHLCIVLCDNSVLDLENITVLVVSTKGACTLFYDAPSHLPLYLILGSFLLEKFLFVQDVRVNINYFYQFSVLTFGAKRKESTSLNVPPIFTSGIKSSTLTP